LLIIPICLGLTALVARRQRRAASAAAVSDGIPTAVIRTTAGRTLMRTGRLVPWFLIGFLLVATINSVGLVRAQVDPALSEVSIYLITVALSAIGLSTDLAGLRSTASTADLGASLLGNRLDHQLGLQLATGTL